MSDRVISGDRVLALIESARADIGPFIADEMSSEDWRVLDILDKLRDAVDLEMKTTETTEAAQSGELAPLPGGGYSRTKFDLDQVRDIHREAARLSPAQRRALLVIFEVAPRYADGFVPGEYLSSSERTLTSLSLREFIGWRDLTVDGGEAHWGYQLTEAGRHAVGKLIALATGR